MILQLRQIFFTEARTFIIVLQIQLDKHRMNNSAS
jgi:hypothetical protein